MVIVIARMKVADGKADEFRSIMQDLASQVLDKEPGCKSYQVCTAREPGVFVIVERYVDKAALEAHGKSEHFTAAFPKLGAVLDGQPQLEVLREVE